PDRSNPDERRKWPVVQTRGGQWLGRFRRAGVFSIRRFWCPCPDRICGMQDSPASCWCTHALHVTAIGYYRGDSSLSWKVP
ncbi:MAG: hypothetical protein P1U77_26550, partial [Rubripirellula sp.]|nr:hypothetical protein [Rubripirellula sp.]